jgi:hypothetical protein
MTPTETADSFWGFGGRVIVAQLVTYFLMGVLAVGAGVHVYAYYDANPDPLFTALQRPLESPLVMAGPLFQILRAAIFALALYPFRSVFLERKWGVIYLWGLFLALAVFAPAGEAPGSIEGLVYTNLSGVFHALYLPEIVIQTLAFSWLLVTWEHHKGKKLLTIPLVTVFVLIVVMIVAGLVLPSGSA